MTETSTGVRFAVKVVPGASRDRVLSLLGDALKIAVTKPPTGGAANEAVISLLADTFDVSEGDISILSGHTNPRKQIEIRGVTVEWIAEVVSLLES